MKKLFGFFILALCLSSCGVQSYLAINQNQHQTSVTLSQQNFEVKAKCQGEAKATYVFGIGGFSRKSLNANSYSEMVKNANLTGSAAIVNATTTEHISGIFPFYFTRKTVTTGQVVVFTK